MIGWKVRVGGDFKAGGKDDGVGAESLGRLSKETQTQKKTVQGDKKHTHTHRRKDTHRGRQKETERDREKPRKKDAVEHPGLADHTHEQPNVG